MSGGPEKAKVEDPFVDQLVRMVSPSGAEWHQVTGSHDHPSVTGRESFRDVVMLQELKESLRRINLDDHGREWLDEGRLATAVSALHILGTAKLMEANQAAHELLLTGATVEGVEGWDGGRTRTVRFIDWEHPERNRFTAVTQFKVEEPGGQAHGHIIPDIVLFVNGIPLVVVECKSPNKSEPVAEAIDQIHRYSNQRKRDGRVEQDEGNERLFRYNAFVVATSFDEARVATIDASSVHYLAWKDTSPTPMAEVAAALGRDRLSAQEILVAGMLTPENLLDLVRHFIVFEVEGGRTIKKVARYQQFRAVQAAVDRLRTGDTRAQDGEHDRRGGLIWHTQGSGKSLSMVFLVRKMRSDARLRRFKVVVVTDRKDLQRQLSDTAALSGEVVQIARSSGRLRGLLEAKGPALVFATIQKYLERDEDGVAKAAIDDDPAFPVLNEDESILVVVDEAHRSHGSTLHANLLRALPNAARIGFTGTPIIMGAKKKTHEIFGEFIDRYTLQQSEADGSTLPILYEGRTSAGAVADGRDLDEVFEDMFRDWSKAEREALQAKYATKGNVMEAERLIQAKARDMLRHYVDNILPNGFKGQVVSVSRRAAVRYHRYLVAARDELVTDIERLPSSTASATDEEASRLPTKTRFLLRARKHLERIQALEFAAVFSSAHNDPGDWAEWSDEAKVAKRIEEFKKPFEHRDPEKRSNLAFVIVKSMLITGWDAPIAQAQYIDRGIQEAELLQAIARVNRTYTGKKAGIVVDYYGVARHLKTALAAYSVEDVQGALKSLADEIPTLRDQHYRVVELFTDRDAELSDPEACIELLDERLRAEFTVKLKAFLGTLDTVLPRPEALPYVADARRLGEISLRARNRYRDDTLRPMGKDVGEKVRELIDQHVISLGIDPKIPPMSMLDARFDAQVKAGRSPRARASEMEHALRYHIRKHLDEDPEHWEKLSQRLDAILTDLTEKWDEIEKALMQLVEDARAGRREAVPGLDAEVHAPFFGVLKQTLGKGVELDEEQLRRLVAVVVELVDHACQEMRIVGFWGNAHAQDVLRKWVVQKLDDANVLPYEKLREAADRVMEVAKANHGRLSR
ncbi:MAG: type I restriction endonuclease subunit R [Myxococcota bacterium]